MTANENNPYNGRINPDIVETVEKSKAYVVTNKDLDITKMELKKDIYQTYIALKEMMHELHEKGKNELTKLDTELLALNLKIKHVSWLIGIGIPGLFALFGYMVKLILGLEK